MKAARPNQTPRKPVDEQPKAQFERDVIAGLSLAQKTLPAKYFYDPAGSTLFQDITALDEYYVTRTETALLREQAEALREFAGPKTIVVEYGAGSSEKALLLLNALEAPAAYICVEIDGQAAAAAASGVAKAMPGLHTNWIAGDFTKLDAITCEMPKGPRLGFFPGSTIGNFEPVKAAALLASFGRHLGDSARMIVGFDRVKPEETLVRAYDDAKGVTAAFNKNVLVRINRELDGAFDLDTFRHEARWSPTHRRIEMHLVSTKRQTVRIAATSFTFAKGESIHTENSYKFDADRIETMVSSSSWRLAHTWSDPAGLFMLAGLER